MRGPDAACAEDLPDALSGETGGLDDVDLPSARLEGFDYGVSELGAPLVEGLVGSAVGACRGFQVAGHLAIVPQRRWPSQLAYGDPIEYASSTATGLANELGIGGRSWVR